MNSSFTNFLNNYLHLAVEDRKSANSFVGHVLSDEWNPYYYEKESGSAVQPKEKDVEKVGTVFDEGTHIQSTVEKTTEITKDDAKTIQDERDVQTEVTIASTEIDLVVVIEIEKEYGVSESMGEAPFHYQWKRVNLICQFHM